MSSVSRDDRPAVRQRAGFTLAELLIAMTLTVSLFAISLPFLVMQLRGLAQDVGRSDAQQTARYVQNTMDRELRNIGIGTTGLNNGLGIPRNQPRVVQADAMAVTFNSDLVANDTTDVEAVYLDPNVPDNLVHAPAATNLFYLPLTSKAYPDYVYRDDAGVLSNAETVSYWAVHDSSSTKADQYVIYRRVNDGPIVTIASGIQITAGQSLFSYSRVNSSAQIVTVPTGSLPIYWDQAGSISDSIRTVTVNVKGIFRGRTLKNDTMTVVRPVNSQTSLMNIGLAQRNSCGDIPLNPGTPVATVVLIGGAFSNVHLTWTASADEAAGEKDVERYVIFRRVNGTTTWDTPVDVVGKGGANYTWDDFDYQSGTTFQYGIAAQDCSPANSTVMVSNAVTHP